MLGHGPIPSRKAESCGLERSLFLDSTPNIQVVVEASLLPLSFLLSTVEAGAVPSLLLGCLGTSLGARNVSMAEGCRPRLAARGWAVCL